MSKSELKNQYVGQVFGSIWVIIHPLFLMALYVFIFNFVFRIKVDNTPEMPHDYTTYILSGLIPWICFQQALAKSCSSIIEQSNLVKQHSFPTEVLPVKTVLTVLLSFLISFLIFIGYIAFRYGLSCFNCFLPLLILCQTLAMIGIAFIFSAVSVFFRDLKDIITVFLTAGLYLLPVFYLPNWVPGIFRPILYINFFSYMTWCYQDALYFGRFEHPWAWLVFCIGSLLLFLIGYRFFRFTKNHFGNFL